MSQQAILKAIQQRNSAGKLTEPAPNSNELEEIFQAALRAPDHAALKPWRFLTIAGDDRFALGELLSDYALSNDAELSKEKQQLMAEKALRAPLVIAPIVKLTEHPKVPEIEQWLSAACAVQNILLAAEALGYGAIWRTGSVAFSSLAEQRLQLADNEKLLGFIYIGTKAAAGKRLPVYNTNDYVGAWP